MQVAEREALVVAEWKERWDKKAAKAREINLMRQELCHRMKQTRQPATRQEAVRLIKLQTEYDKLLDNCLG